MPVVQYCALPASNTSPSADLVTPFTGPSCFTLAFALNVAAVTFGPSIG